MLKIQEVEYTRWIPCPYGACILAELNSKQEKKMCNTMLSNNCMKQKQYKEVEFNGWAQEGQLFKGDIWDKIFGFLEGENNVSS